MSRIITNTKNLDLSKIYAYFEPSSKGIFKTMEIQNKSHKRHAFVRIDNHCGYCQHLYETLEDLVKHHSENNHKSCYIYEFDDQKQFFKWCNKILKEVKQP